MPGELPPIGSRGSNTIAMNLENYQVEGGDNAFKGLGISYCQCYNIKNEVWDVYLKILGFGVPEEERSSNYRHYGTIYSPALKKRAEELGIHFFKRS